MIPVLYDSITEGSVPANFGRGPLTDCLLCTVHEERNSEDELVLEYAADGIHAEDIQALKIILAKPNYTDNPQLFEIYKVGKVMNGRFTVNARHISYRLSNKLITTGSASSCAAACALLDAQAGNFTITTDKTATGAFRVAEPSSVRSWFGGKQGSLLDVFGGEWKYDNFTASLLQARGADRGVTIRNGKNLTQLSQEISIENLATAILPYYKDMDGNVTTGAKINTGLTLDSPREIAVDFSQQVDPDSATPIVTQLANLGAAYISNNNFTVAINSITLGYEDLEGLNERVDLCDTVKIYFEALGISATAKCVATTWDVLAERYTACTFGNARANIADTIAATSKELAQTPSTSFMAEAISHATELITGNLGGYVILHDADGDGYPDEILIMNTADISTATQVWRWNKNGLGYATSYAGPYGTAITQAGKIVADYVATGTLDASKITVQHLSASSIDTGAMNASLITTGTLNANIIKAGTISDTQGNSSINMTNGSANMLDFKAKTSLSLVDTSNTVRGLLSYNLVGGTSFDLKNQDGELCVTLNANTGATGGSVSVFKPNSGGAGVSMSGNGLSLTQSGGGARTIFLNGETGHIMAIAYDTPSSRKVKENIKPIEDAARILELQAVSFDYKDKAQGVNKRGFIAEDVAEILPGLVTQATEDTPAALDYVGMIPYLQSIIKDHEKRIAELEETITEMKARS